MTEQQIRIALFAGIGAIAGVAIGFLLTARGSSFVNWLTEFDRGASWLWIAMGAFVGGAIAYLRRQPG